jgi:hypothetical protein
LEEHIVLGRLKGGMSVSRDHFFRYIPLLENIRREFRIRKTAPTIQSLIELALLASSAV